MKSQSGASPTRTTAQYGTRDMRVSISGIGFDTVLSIDGREYTIEDLLQFGSAEEALAAGVSPLVVLNYHGTWGGTGFTDYLFSLTY
jgi:hypothetical protein